ncbi:MAG: UDP-glucose 4-epimerase GalE [Actinobacteria bacterium]|nr:UDP-glucose 4-epimerase GalE [Actinomycetota bacterium]MDA2952516.1 UDP-glucose 4-epimerase GalE [Actinomycetota bacterium]MDA2999295.1 UDP-glucose 4-epimerase GalE [Actinomycetota bacterium]
MAVLVTGGAGYIGSHTVALLTQQQRDVVVLDSLELGTKSRIDTVPFFQGNISDERLIEKICKKHDITEVIHFAAYKAVGESMEQPLRYYNNNVGGTIDLVRALLANGVERMVFSSSAAVYGNPASVPVTEDSPLLPESVYAETKAVMERFLASCDAIGMRSVSLRYFNAAGASADSSIGEDWSMSQNLVPLVMKAILGFSGPLNVFGNDYPTPDGTCIRDYIHVEDLADAHVKALDYLKQGGASLACNVGTGRGTSVLEVIDIAEQVSGRKVPHVITSRRAGDPTSVYADPTLVRALLGWKATRDLRDIITSAWNWHSKIENV